MTAGPGLQAAAYGGPALSSASETTASTRPYLPYTADSFFRSRVAGAPIDAKRTAAFRSFMASHPDQKGIRYPKINGVGNSRWGQPWAKGQASDPVWKLVPATGYAPNSRSAFLGKAGFHAPDWLGKQITGTSDSPLSCMDTAGGFTMMVGRAKLVAPYTIEGYPWAVTWHTSNGLDYRNPRSNDHRNWTSRGRITDSLLIRRDLVDYAMANGTGLGHVLQIYLAETLTSDGFCHPMVGCESGKNGFGAEGERIAIAPSVDLTTRGLTPVGLAIARTLQQHGAYIGDNAGSASAIKAEQTSAARNPWSGLNITQDCLRGITWDDFVVLPRGWSG